jgi:SAM-dependent methyltransferase
MDIGCANGGSSRKLLARTGCRLVGVDLLPHLVEMGQAENRRAGVQDRFQIRQGSILAIPFPARHFDFVFCRDMLSVDEHLPQAIAECRRVLQPGRFMLIYVTLATERLSAEERVELEDNLGCGSMDEGVLDACLAEEFTLTQKIVLGSQGVQRRLESGDNGATHNLLRIARLTTWKADYVAEHGERNYDIALADLKWQVYILLGKLQSIVYLLRSPQ